MSVASPAGGSSSGRAPALGILLALSLLAAAWPAAAGQRLGREAARLNRKAEGLFLEGKYVEAEAHFARAYAAEPNATVLFNVGLCQEKQGRPLDAWRSYERLLRQHPKLAFRADVEARSLALQQALAKTHTQLKLRTRPPGAAIYLDGSPAPAGTSPHEAWLPAGPHRARIVLEGFLTVQEELVLVAGTPQEHDFALVAEDAPGRIELQEAGLGTTVSVDGKVVGTTPTHAIV